MFDLHVVLFIDVILVIISGFLLLRHARMSHSHPAVFYLFFHIYSVTLRVWSIIQGSPTLFTGWGRLLMPVTEREIIRAALMFDVALVVVTFAWIKAAVDDSRRYSESTSLDETPSPNLSKAHIWRVVAVILPIGLVGLFSIARLPGQQYASPDLGGWERSSLLKMTQMWPGLAFLALIYWYGFRPLLVLPMVGYLIIMMYQGFHRFRFLIPLILLLQIYLDRKGRRWPTKGVIVVLVCAFLVMFPLKTIGQMAQQGKSVSQIVDTSLEILEEDLVRAEDTDRQFLDEFAMALTLFDENGKVYYGRTFLPLLSLPIPRPLWPGKPSQDEYLDEISRPWRPMSDFGMIVTFLGEAYGNFHYIGIVVIPFLIAYGLARLYFVAYRNSFFSTARLFYLTISANMILLYRGGLTVVPRFVFIKMAPLIAIVVLHYLKPVDSSTLGSQRYDRSVQGDSFLWKQTAESIE